jgi:hypothetical protein
MVPAQARRSSNDIASARTGKAWLPSASISAATASSSGPVRALIATLAPCFASASAIERPIPRPPPGTHATLPRSLFVIGSPFYPVARSRKQVRVRNMCGIAVRI